MNLKNNINDPLTSVFSNSESCSFDYTAYDVPKELKVLWATVKELKQLDLPRSVGSTAKNYFSCFFDFDFAIKSINCRLNTSSYLFFENVDEEGEKQYFKAKASMRGNYVYRARVWNRHKELIKFCEVNRDIFYILPDSHGFHSNILKFTLTPDIKLFSRDEFNLYIVSNQYDLFIKRLRNEFPGVVVARSYETHTRKARGYIHINVIAIFPDYDFPVFNHTSRKTKNSKGEYVKTWRLKSYPQKRQIDDMWACGFVDTRAIENPDDLCEYSLKYYIKEVSNRYSKNNQSLTLSVLSLYNKRGFSFPRKSITRETNDFCETVINYTVGLENLKPVFFPRLDIIMHNSLDSKFLALVVDYYNEYDSKVWYEIVDKPPDLLDPLNEYDGCFMHAPALVRFDYGSRLNEQGYYYNPVFTSPKYTHQKKFKKYKFNSSGKIIKEKKSVELSERGKRVKRQVLEGKYYSVGVIK